MITAKAYRQPDDPRKSARWRGESRERYNKPVIGVAGSLTADVGVVHDNGLDAVFSVIYTICSLEDALENAQQNVQMAARNIAAVIKMGQGMSR